ncbi:hypothetical protein [Streptomyces sp. NPDC001401]|uniref:hypothetical protein n=1 Tax=Streptomyces sp. NPDC001401 TaxID=3364570 RepID=UPI0036A51F39
MTLPAPAVPRRPGGGRAGERVRHPSQREWWGNQLWQGSPDSPRDDALAAVAEAAQDTLTECLWQAWPVCAVHDLGMHLSEKDGRPAWRCTGAGRDPEHVRAEVGELRELVRDSPAVCDAGGNSVAEK